MVQKALLRCLVTGGSGLLGSALVRRLLSMGAAVTVIGTGMAPGVRYVSGSPTDARSVQKAVARTTCIFHLAEYNDSSMGSRNPALCARGNTLGTLMLLKHSPGSARFVYASTAEVYGDGSGKRKEAKSPVPKSHYAASKLTAEYYCKAFAHTHGLSTISLRLFDIYGPGVQGNAVGAYLNSQGTLCYPSEVRDYVHVDDAVSALLAAAVTGRQGIVNIGAGRPVSTNSLLKMLNAVFGRRVALKAQPSPPWHIPHLVADIGQARLLGFTPQVSLSEGLQGLVRRT